MTPHDAAADPQQIIADLERKLAESVAQQAAATEVLQIINGSGGDLKPVLDVMVTKAAELCDATGGGLFLVEGDKTLNYGGTTNRTSAAPYELMGVPLSSILGPNPQDRPFVHVVDLKATKAYRNGVPFIVASVESDMRSWLGVPVINGGVIVAVFALFRKEVRPFSENQIRLLQSFAVQASIAMKNARLFNETQEALERQTATADILRVISESPTDVQPVFQTIAEHARLLCKAQVGATTRLEGDMVYLAGVRSRSADAEEAMRSSFPIPLKFASPNIRRAIIEQVPIQIPDVHLDSDYSHLVDGTQRMGFRSIMSVPLMHEGRSIGTIGVAREEPGLFPDAAVSLLQTFADQAVIAIQNVRLFDEVQAKTRDLTESLQQQTATADVLKVISRSAFDLQTVLDALVESAMHLCEAESAHIFRCFDTTYKLAACRGYSREYEEHMKLRQIKPGRGSIVGRIALEHRLVHILDVLADTEYSQPESQKLGRWRTMLGVPLMREGTAIGALTLTRSVVKPFTDKQIELVQTFADQAVIAIENVRLFDEVQTRTKELAASLDELRTTQDRLVQTEKLASLGQLTAGIAHEIKNPLNFVNNFSALSAELVDELDETLAPASLDEKMRGDVGELTAMLKSNLEKVVQHGKRADSIVKNMLLHSREGSGEHRSADINALVEESLNLAYHGARAEKPGFDVTLKRDLDPHAGAVDLYPQEITRALLNLISNGFYAATQRKSVEGVTFEPVLIAATKNRGKTVEIRIRDNGTGIPDEVKEKIFNPFFTTKPSGEGTGLGLSMSHDIIVKQHGGSIDVDTVPGLFTEFTIVLPRTNQT